MYWSSVPEFYQDVILLLLLQEKKNILFRMQEIKLLYGSKVDSLIPHVTFTESGKLKYSKNYMVSKS